MKIMIAIPSMDQVAAEFAQSLASLRKVGDCIVAFQLSSLIYDARNNLLKKALQIGADYVLWLDSDMVFGPDLLEKLLEDMDGRDIVSGIYFRRRPPYTPVLMSVLEEAHTEDVLEYPEDEIFEIAGCGFGCLLMKADVARNVLLQTQNWFTPAYGLGEDLAFCRRAKDTGYKIWCDPRVKCGHVGHAIITDEFYKAMKEK